MTSDTNLARQTTGAAGPAPGLWRRYGFTFVLLIIVAAVAAWALGTGAQAGDGLPHIGVSQGIALVLVGLVAGVLGGLIGTGGCSVMLPSIHFWMGYSAPIAVGTTLFAVIFTAVSGGYAHLVRRNLDKRATLWLGGFGIIGVIVGSWLFTKLTSETALLGLILGIAFLWPAVRMVWEGVGLPGGKVINEGTTMTPHKAGWAVFGSGIGVLTGVVGLGGGYALVPGLIYLFGAPVYLTMGTSLATMIPLAIVGGGIKLAGGYVAIAAGSLLAGGTIVGAQIGAAVIKRFKPGTLKLIFGLYFLYVSVKFITAYFGVSIW
jgi:hypothetical protein